MGIIGYYISNRGVFFFVTIMSIPTLISLFLIDPNEINYALARGGNNNADKKHAKVGSLLKDKPLIIFLVCSILFHFANAALLPLLGEMLAKGQGRKSMMFMSACVVTTQLVIDASERFY